MPERADGTLQGALSQTVRTPPDHPRSKGTRSHGYHCENRDRHENVRHGSLLSGMVWFETPKRCQQRTLQKQKSDTRKQVSQTNIDRNRMGRIKNPELFLLQLQLHPDNCQEKSKMKIQVAIARRILVAVWHMLSKEEDFIDVYLKRLEEQRAKGENNG